MLSLITGKQEDAVSVNCHHVSSMFTTFCLSNKSKMIIHIAHENREMETQRVTDFTTLTRTD